MISFPVKKGMSSLSAQPSMRLLLYAHQGYQLSEGERAVLEERAWARSLPRDAIPRLRRLRWLSWEVARLEERQRDRLPDAHPLVRMGGRISRFHQRRERRSEELARERAMKSEERQRLFDSLPPLAIHERDQLAFYRPISETHCLRLTEGGRKDLCAFRFSSFGFADAIHLEGLDARIVRFRETHDALNGAAWWRGRVQRLISTAPDTSHLDALWLAAILSRSTEDVVARLNRAESVFTSFAQHHLWRQDPLPLCLLLLSSNVHRTVEAVVEANNALVGLGLGVGVSIMASATALVAGTPAPDIPYRVAELHQFWKAWIGYGLAFSDALLPSAARLSTARRPVERSALLIRDLDQRTTRFSRMNDRATRIAATLLADLPLDYLDRGEGIDLFCKDDPYIQMLLRRYRPLRTAMVPRCGREPAPEAQATILAALLALCPGEPDPLIDLFDSTRRQLSDSGLPREAEGAAFVLLAMESAFREEWGVDHARYVWDIYFGDRG